MKLMVTAYTPVGTFIGHLTDDPLASKEDLQKSMNYLQSETLTYLVIYTDEGEMTLYKNLLANSALCFKIVD